MLLLLAVDLWYQPLWAFDAWTFWTPKAHALFEMNGLDARWFGAQDLRNVDYPLLLPAVESATFRFTGYETSLLDFQSWLGLVAFCAATVEVVSRLGGRRSVLYGALLTVVFAPSVADQLAGAEADLRARACAPPRGSRTGGSERSRSPPFSPPGSRRPRSRALHSPLRSSQHSRWSPAGAGLSCRASPGSLRSPSGSFRGASGSASTTFGNR
jgi:hypothetical protein